MNKVGEIPGYFWTDKNEESIPYKDSWYLNRHYFEHPINRYEIYGILEKFEVKGIVIMRVQEYGNSKAIRIIDYIGDVSKIRYIGMLCEKQMELYNAEYTDMYC